MQIKDYYQILMSTASEPQLVARAYEQYYKRIYERTLQLNSEIISNTEQVESDGKSIVSIENNGTIYIFDKADIMNEFATFNNLVDGSGLDSNSYQVELFDLLSEETITIDIKTLATQMGINLDTTFLTWQGFKSILSNAIESPQEFLNIVSAKTSNAYSAVKNTVSAIYELLSNAGSNINAKLEAMIHFTGLYSVVQDPEHTTEDENIDLKNYTGINPITAWLNGLDWKKFSTWFSPYQAIALTVAIGKFVANVIKTVALAIGRTIKKVCSKIGNWFKRTFLDPIDYKCDGDTISYFKLPFKFILTKSKDLSNEDVYQNMVNLILNQFDDGAFFSEGPVLYKFIGKIAPDSENFEYYGCERYIKPVDPNKVFEIVRKYVRIDPDNHAESQYWDTKYERWDKRTSCGLALQAAQELSESDLSLRSDAPEKDVYYGLLLSLIISEFVKNIKWNFFDMFMSVDATILDPLKNVLFNSNMDNMYIDLDRAFAILEGSGILGFYAIMMDKLYCCSGIISGNLQSSDFASGGTNTTWDWTVFNHQFGTFNNYPSTITNKMFLELLTSYIYTDLETGTGTYMNAGTVGSTSLETFYYVDNYEAAQSISTSLSWTKEGITAFNSIYTNSFILTMLILNASRNLQAGTQYDGAYIPYSQTNFSDFKPNTSIVTDSQNADLFSDFLTGAVITIGAIAIGIVVGKVVISAIRNYNTMKFTRDTLAFNYGDAIAAGDIDRANSIYKQWNAYNVKANLYKACFGSTTALASSTASNGFDFNNIFYSNENIVNLIKSN